MRSIPILLAALVATVAAAPAAAQGSHRDTVAELLREATREAAERGFPEAPRVFDGRQVVGMLPAGGVVVVEANLRAGVRYTVIGVCDRDCVDLDLRVHAPEGDAVLGEDVNTDDVPVVTFTAREDGPHPLTVVMSDCGAELCYFAVRVAGR